MVKRIIISALPNSSLQDGGSGLPAVYKGGSE